VKVGVSSWFSNLAEYEERHRTGAFDKSFPVADADQIRRELMLADLVEPLGFDAFWTIEHHFTPYGMTNNPIQLLTYLAGRTSRIELGTMVLVLPWHEPLKLAENLAILDILLGGRRLNIGVGRGFAAREFNALRIPYEDSRTRMKECLDIIRIALTSEFFSYEGEHFTIPRTTIRPRPLTPDLTENLLMTWTSPESLDMAANSGAAPLFTNYHDWAVVMGGLETFNQIRASHGWPASPAAIATTVYVDHDHQRAQETGEHYWRKTSGMTVWHYDRLASPYFLPEASPAERQAAVTKGYEGQSSAGLFGSPEQVTEQIRELVKVADIGHLITLHSFGDMPADMVETSMRLFAAEVLPTIKTFGRGEPRSIPYADVTRAQVARAHQ